MASFLEDIEPFRGTGAVNRQGYDLEKFLEKYDPCLLYTSAIGNAPTALVRLYEMIKEGRIRPALIIGVPVGFVNVVESKELIMSLDIPYIVAEGRKGGSNIAAAICNALLYQADNF